MERSEIKTDVFSHECGQCGNFFKSREDVYKHSHTNDIVRQMRDNGDSEEDIKCLIDYNQQMGLSDE